jgi:hypothetical protein
MLEDLTNLEKWNEVTRGLYRFVIAAKVCYEIHVLYHGDGTDILTAKASLFLVGNWQAAGNSFFERECIMKEMPVFICLQKAREDYMDHL